MAESVYTPTNLKLLPAGPSVGTTVTSFATVHAYGAYVEFLASAATDIYIYGCVVKSPPASNIQYAQISIATGGSGSEVEKAVTKTTHTMDSQLGSNILFPIPLRVAAGSRVAVRVADALSSTNAIPITLLFAEVPDIVNPVLAEVANPTFTVVTDGANSATTFKTNRTEATNDFWKDCYAKATTGALLNQVRRVTGYNGTTKFITCDAFTSTPATGVIFEIVNQ